MTGREEGNAASQSQSTDTDSGHSAASDGNSESIEFRVHVCPSVARSNSNRGEVTRWCDLVDSAQIDCYALLDVRGASERSVTSNGQSAMSKHRGIDNLPSASHGKVTFARQSLTSDVQERHCESNIAAGGRCDETCGIHISFLRAPVRSKGFVVARAAGVEDFLGQCKFESSTLRQDEVGQLLQRRLS